MFLEYGPKIGLGIKINIKPAENSPEEKAAIAITFKKHLKKNKEPKKKRKNDDYVNNILQKTKK